MIPLKDDNPRRMWPITNYLLIAANIVVFIYQPPDLEAFSRIYGAIPQNIMQGMNLHTLFTAMFVHGNLMHLLGNMLYLWIFGDNVEGTMGHGRYFFFYLLCGLAATFSHIAIESSSQYPMIGASGAISGVLGAYLLKFPHARVLILVPFFLLFRVPALVVLGIWFVMQLTSGLTSFQADVSGGVAWFAHVGGFLAGMVLVKLFERRQNFERFRRQDAHWEDFE
ncbi:MAG: rhomboid family intramembrane serine protease [candidate division KSB1 bacterium]|nr:rhomboid family intramembrane serine protease [candidate division KSB1 bacterium]MDZ7303359.1 rhomboid family intramembrane serine protease [candidate division KSB1 bacterium]MDZ7312323.1 rhomboid family intramembrane serine protease [candidate division KSB1 bacterium]